MLKHSSWWLMMGLCGLIPLSIAASQSDSLENRCGWFSNPTPGNLWLNDRDGEWTIGVQGGHQADGDWEWPDFNPSQWVKTNGEYGYGCACFKLRVDHPTHHVLFIEKTRARPLTACENDPALRKKTE